MRPTDPRGGYVTRIQTRPGCSSSWVLSTSVESAGVMVMLELLDEHGPLTREALCRLLWPTLAKRHVESRWHNLYARYLVKEMGKEQPRIMQPRPGLYALPRHAL